MNLEKKISIIVVCYNQQDTIARTLDSILAQQDCSPFEILVSDDCSADSTAEIARKYASKYPELIKVHVNEHNLGVQKNYFDAMRRAEGIYIADCAGDDYWCDPLKLAKEEKVLDAYPEVTLVHTGWEYEYPDGSSLHFSPADDPRPDNLLSRDALIQHLCGTVKPFIHLCTSLYRKKPILDALEKNPDIFLNPDYRCEDLQVSAAAAAAGNIAFIPDVTLRYSVGHNSISSAESAAKSFDFYFGTTSLRLKLINLHNIPENFKKETIRRYADYMMWLAYRAKSPARVTKLKNWLQKNGFRLTLKQSAYRLLVKYGTKRE